VIEFRRVGRHICEPRNAIPKSVSAGRRRRRRAIRRPERIHPRLPQRSRPRARTPRGHDEQRCARRCSARDCATSQRYCARTRRCRSAGEQRCCSSELGGLAIIRAASFDGTLGV